jgi:hypothetical protein
MLGQARLPTGNSGGHLRVDSSPGAGHVPLLLARLTDQPKLGNITLFLRKLDGPAPGGVTSKVTPCLLSRGFHFRMGMDQFERRSGCLNATPAAMWFGRGWTVTVVMVPTSITYFLFFYNLYI